MRQASTRFIGVAVSTPLLPSTDPGGQDVFVDIRFQLVVRRHLVTLAAFFVEAHPPALALG
jgi:hypothetical protein